MNEPKPGGHNDKAENKGNNPEKQNLVQRFNAPPGDQSAAAPKTDTITPDPRIKIGLMFR